MWSWASLIFISLQLSVAAYAALVSNKALFTVVFTEMSPILLLFSLIDKAGVNLAIRVTSYLFLSFAWNLLKYTAILCSLYGEGKNRVIILALLMEAAYIALATALLVTNWEL